MNKLILISLLILVAFIATILARTFILKSSIKKPINKPNFDASALYERAPENLSNALKIKTISHANYENFDLYKFEDFINFVQNTYPSIFNTVEFTRVNNYNIVLKWNGKDKNLAPVLFTAHYDVVDVAENTLKDWKFPPFEGQIENNIIYGRGTQDDKTHVIAHFEALNSLIEKGFTPNRDIYYAICHDEEVGSEHGAKVVSKYFQDKGLFFDLVWDEGGRVLKSENGTQTALIGIGEKGRIVSNVKIQTTGGHASRPAQETSVTNLAKAITVLNKNQIKPVMLPSTEKYLLDTFNNYDFYMQMLIANRDILKPLLIRQMEKTPSLNATMRSTMAITKLEASKITNVIPEYSQMTIDSRIVYPNTPEEVKNHIEEIIKKELPSVKFEIETSGIENPSKIADENNPLLVGVKKEITEIYPSANIVPFLVLGGTDARNYENVTNTSIRFLPISITQEEVDSMHNTNESISLDNLKRMIYFYEEYIKNNL